MSPQENGAILAAFIVSPPHRGGMMLCLEPGDWFGVFGKERPWRNITFPESGRLDIYPDRVRTKDGDMSGDGTLLVDALRRHHGNQGAGGSDFFELDQDVLRYNPAALPASNRGPAIPPGGLTAEDNEDLERLEKAATENIPPPAVESAREAISRAIERFRIPNVLRPKPTDKVFILRVRAHDAWEALLHAGIVKGTNDGRGNSGTGQETDR